MAWNSNPIQHRSTLGNPTMAGAAGLINAEMSGVDRIAGGLDSYNQGNAITKKRAELEAKGYLLDENGKVLQAPNVAGVSGLSGGGSSGSGGGRSGGRRRRGKGGSGKLGANGLAQGEVGDLSLQFASAKEEIANYDNQLARKDLTMDQRLAIQKGKDISTFNLAQLTKKASSNYAIQKSMMGSLGGAKTLKSGKAGKSSSGARPKAAKVYASEAKYNMGTPEYARKLPWKHKFVKEGITYLNDGSKATQRNIERYFKKLTKYESESLVANRGLPKHL